LTSQSSSGIPPQYFLFTLRPILGVFHLFPPYKREFNVVFLTFWSIEDRLPARRMTFIPLAERSFSIGPFHACHTSSKLRSNFRRAFSPSPQPPLLSCHLSVGEPYGFVCLKEIAFLGFPSFARPSPNRLTPSHPVFKLETELRVLHFFSSPPYRQRGSDAPLTPTKVC